VGRERKPPKADFTDDELAFTRANQSASSTLGIRYRPTVVGLTRSLERDTVILPSWLESPSFSVQLSAVALPTNVETTITITILSTHIIQGKITYLKHSSFLHDQYTTALFDHILRFLFHILTKKSQDPRTCAALLPSRPHHLAPIFSVLHALNHHTSHNIKKKSNKAT
jgi:hypothetical protein